MYGLFGAVGLLRFYCNLQHVRIPQPLKLHWVIVFLMQFSASGSSPTPELGLDNWFSIVIFSIWEFSRAGAGAG